MDCRKVSFVPLLNMRLFHDLRSFIQRGREWWSQWRCLCEDLSFLSVVFTINNLQWHQTFVGGNKRSPNWPIPTWYLCSLYSPDRKLHFWGGLRHLWRNNDSYVQRLYAYVISSHTAINQPAYFSHPCGHESLHDLNFIICSRRCGLYVLATNSTVSKTHPLHSFELNYCTVIASVPARWSMQHHPEMCSAVCKSWLLCSCQDRGKSYWCWDDFYNCACGLSSRATEESSVCPCYCVLL